MTQLSIMSSVSLTVAPLPECCFHSFTIIRQKGWVFLPGVLCIPVWLVVVIITLPEGQTHPYYLQLLSTATSIAGRIASILATRGLPYLMLFCSKWPAVFPMKCSSALMATVLMERAKCVFGVPCGHLHFFKEVWMHTTHGLAQRAVP